MARTLLVLILTILPFSLCGANPVSNGLLQSERIVGGEPVRKGEYPSFALIDLLGHRCGGVLISRYWVVTTTWCIHQMGHPRSKFITVGDHIMDSIEGTEQRSRVHAWAQYEEEFNWDTIENDIAILAVDPPFELNEWVQPVQLPEQGAIAPDTATLVGRGYDETGNLGRIISKVVLPKVDKDHCVATSQPGNHVANSTVCYGETGKGACTYDNGDPLIVNNTLVGVSSWDGGCGRENAFGTYSDLSRYVDWIRPNIVVREEDPAPLEQIDTCGGTFSTTSGRIQVSNISPGQKCVWTVASHTDTVRFQLLESSLTQEDGLYVTRVHGGVTTEHIRITEVNTDYETGGTFLVITLSSASSSNTSLSFTLDFYTSGSEFYHKISGHAYKNQTSGMVAHPRPGLPAAYVWNENAAFVIASPDGQDKRVDWTYFNVNTAYGFVTAYAWQEDHFQQIRRFIQYEYQSFTIPGGIGIVALTTGPVSDPNYDGISFHYY